MKTTMGIGVVGNEAFHGLHINFCAEVCMWEGY